MADQARFVKEELAVTRAAGVKPIVLSDDEWKKVQELQWNGGLVILKKIAPEENYNALKKIVMDAGWYPPKNVPPVPPTVGTFRVLIAVDNIYDCGYSRSLEGMVEIV